MYVVTLTIIDHNGEAMYVIPTNQGFENMTYCYVFDTNQFNYDVHYNHGQYIDDFELYNGDVIEDVFTLGENIEPLKNLNRWDDIEEYFMEV